MPVVLTTGVHGPDRAEARGDSTVAILGQGYLTCRSLCNDTCPWSHRAAGPRGVSTVADFWTRYPQGCLCKKPLEILQSQALDMPVVICNVSCAPTVLTVQKLVEMLLLQVLDKAVDMPVVMPRQMPTVLIVQKPAGDSTVAVHRQGRGHLCCRGAEAVPNGPNLSSRLRRPDWLQETAPTSTRWSMSHVVHFFARWSTGCKL